MQPRSSLCAGNKDLGIQEEVLWAADLVAKNVDLTQTSSLVLLLMSLGDQVRVTVIATGFNDFLTFSSSFPTLNTQSTTVKPSCSATATRHCDTSHSLLAPTTLLMRRV